MDNDVGGVGGGDSSDQGGESNGVDQDTADSISETMSAGDSDDEGGDPASGGQGNADPGTDEDAEEAARQSQEALAEQGRAARETFERQMEEATPTNAATEPDVDPADVAADLIDQYSPDTREWMADEDSVNTKAVAEEVLDMAREDPDLAVEVRSALTEQLSEEHAAELNAELAAAIEEDNRAIAALGDGNAASVDPEVAEARAAELLEAHTRTRTIGPVQETYVDTLNLAFDVTQIEDPALAGAVRNQLSLDLPPAEAREMNRVIGSSNWADKMNLAISHPADGVIGAGKAIANGFSAVGEIFARGATYQAAGEQMRAAGMSALVGNDAMAERQMAMGLELNEAARTTDFVPQFEMDNLAQQGGEIIGTAIDVALAGKGLVTGGARALAGLTDEAVGVADDIAGAAARVLDDIPANRGLDDLIEAGTVRSADEVNATFPDGYSPPYTPGTQAVEFVADGQQTFVRVVNGDRPGGAWIMEADDIRDLTPEQIADKFALPEVPTGFTQITPPAGTRIRTGDVNPNFGRPGGGTQFQLLDRVNDGWADIQPFD